MTQNSSGELYALAHEHLPSDVAERWLGLLRPGIRLAAAGGDEAVVGQLGGEPRLPDTMEWPEWEGQGPLSFIASVDCAALPADALDIPFPASGTLSFFFYDGQLDGDEEAFVEVDDPETWAGARVVHVPAGVPTSRRDTPCELESYPHVPLAAHVRPTVAEPTHPQIQEALAPDAEPFEEYEHPVCGRKFVDGLWQLDDEVGHQLGGTPQSVQGPVELEVARAAIGPGTDWHDPRLVDEMREWVLLAQFDTDDAADMMWGDTGCLYWLIRRDDLAELRFDKAMFTWQCC
ncbi:YwqG family protein [Streptomyces sp. NPDC050703]|uniref:YwqG family protein n=1 Tax=Streptomyces sp. NPDC050703 TaxID=3157218 RepID=UPI00343C37E7